MYDKIKEKEKPNRQSQFGKRMFPKETNQYKHLTSYHGIVKGLPV